MSESISVLLVDDHAMVRQGVRAFLVTQPDLSVVGEAGSGEEAVKLAAQFIPDVILMDLIMPGMDGFQILAEKSRDPSISHIPVIVISARDPVGEPMLGNTLSITQSGGFTVASLMDCLQAMSNVFSPLAKTSNDK